LALAWSREIGDKVPLWIVHWNQFRSTKIPDIGAGYRQGLWIRSGMKREEPRMVSGRLDSQPSVFLDAPNTCSDCGQLFLDALVAAIDVIDAVDEGFAFRDEGGQD